jgi:hypothetical membrane protein
MTEAAMTHTNAAQTRGQASAGTAARERPAQWISWAAWAGIVGPFLFTATFLAQEAFRRGEYHPLGEPVSALEGGPHGWIQQLNFVVFGLLTIAFAVGLNRGLRPTRAGIIGPALLFLSGIGSLHAAIFPLREDAAGVTYDPGLHFIAGFTVFLSSALGLIVVSRRLARDARWRDIATYTLIAGLISFVGFAIGGTLVVPDGAPLHEWLGLYQRLVVLAVIFPCRVVLSLRLWQIASGRR